MFAGVIFVVSSSSELQSPPLSTHNILAPGTTLVLSSQRFHIHGEGKLRKGSLRALIRSPDVGDQHHLWKNLGTFLYTQIH